MKNPSGFLLDLYRASRRLPHAQLRPFVYDRLQAVIQFDTGFWYRWAMEGGESFIQAWYLYKQPTSLIEEYEANKLWLEDAAYLKTLEVPRGVAVHASYSEFTSERMRSFLKRHRQEHILNIAIEQEIPQVAAGISLYRNETREGYSADDCAIMEAVAPHILDAWRENWLNQIVRETSTKEPVDFSLAVLTPKLMMSEAQDNFGDVMHLEWPGWQGPWLPRELHRAIGNAGNERNAGVTGEAGNAGAEEVGASRAWLGISVAVYFRRQADASVLVLVRSGHPMDRLAPRKRAVALMFAQGASQNQVASKLHLATSTVNNYLGDVYQQLNITDKVDLFRLVNRLDPWIKPALDAQLG